MKKVIKKKWETPLIKKHAREDVLILSGTLGGAEAKSTGST